MTEDGTASAREMAERVLVIGNVDTAAALLAAWRARDAEEVVRASAVAQQVVYRDGYRLSSHSRHLLKTLFLEEPGWCKGDG